jgi:hypothetical protein
MPAAVSPDPGGARYLRLPPASTRFAREILENRTQANAGARHCADRPKPSGRSGGPVLSWQAAEQTCRNRSQQFLRAIPDQRLRRGIQLAAWWLLAGGGAGHPERRPEPARPAAFASRHHRVPTDRQLSAASGAGGQLAADGAG